MDIKGLYAPLELKSRRGRGGDYAYVSWQDVANRMNEIFDCNWSSEIKSQEVLGNNVVVRVRVTAMDPETKVLHYQEGFGGAINDERAEAGNPHKSAYSKALKDACKKWGIGMYLDDEAGAPAPTTVVTPPTPSAPVATPPVPAAATPPPAAPPAPAVSTPTVPPPNVAVEAPVAAPPATPAPAMPPTPPPAPAASNMTQEMPMSSGAVLSNDDNGGITEVQQIALEGILGMRDLNYEDLAKEAFEDKGMKYDNIPRAEDLTYEEAVVVVKFGNDKYRNK